MQQPTTSNRLRPFRPMPFGRYTLLMPLSIGGMGEIFLARMDGPQGFEKLCVIKKILPHLAEDQDFVTRFGNEARTLVKLTHGSIAQVLDMGQHQGEPYLALEYIDGKDLRKVGARFRERGMPLPLTFVLFVMGRVLDALAYAHRKRDDDDKEIGLVHRDMSPQNILISYEGEVKVIDFGLAKSTLNAAKTNPSIILGKFLYMSPEQARHAKVDRRSDLYAVGLCLYELIAGKNPFEEVPPHALMAAVATPHIAHVQQVEPLCPTHVAQVIMKALAIDPAQRFQTAEELRGRLLSCLLEVDPAAGPESCSKMMRDAFSAEYLAERKLLSQLKEAARSELQKMEPAGFETTRPAQVRPLIVAKPNPRLEPPPADEATPVPTDPRRYGLQPAAPRAPLSFTPTPKLGGAATDAPNERDRETLPGVVIDRTADGGVRIIGKSAEADTGPHPMLYPAAPSPEMTADAPTRPVPVTGAPRPAAGKANEITAPSIEPITSEAPVVAGPSDLDLPSVMVIGMPSQQHAPRPITGKNAPVKAQVSSVLVPASTVRTPEVVAPLPKALEGKSRPDENLATDRGTRSRRSSIWVVLLPLLAVAVAIGFVVHITLQSEAENNPEPDTRGQMRPPARQLTAPTLVDEPEPPPSPEGGAAAPEPQDAPPPTTTEPAPAAAATASPADDDLPRQLVPPPAATKKAGPKSKAASEALLKLKHDFHLKVPRLEVKRVATLAGKLDKLDQRAEVAAPGSVAERQLLKDIGLLKVEIEAAK